MKMFLLGGLVFFISQIVLRIPIINNILPISESYVNFIIMHPIIHIFFLSLTAGLFEEIGRVIGFKVLKNKNLKFKDAVIYLWVFLL
ncbi:MAG: YhfC family glutamic-type intramembrane protease [Sarcina sp.]